MISVHKNDRDRPEANMDIASMYPEEVKELMISLGEKPFRAGQIFSWIHEKGAGSYDEMTNLSKNLREKLKTEYPLVTLEEKECLVSKEDEARKYLFQLPDGNVVESVWMKYSYGNSVCISSQVGCAMGCTFCASTIGGKVRDLTASEMLGQIYEITRLTGERVDNVVVMGIGEPMDNYDNIVRFIRILSHPNGLNLSQRSITVSTCGLVPKIYEFAKEKLAVTLAISLHAYDDETRKALMPVAKAYSIDELLAAAKEYYSSTGRRVTFEYALVSGKNDSEKGAEKLAALLKGFPCHVNLIRVNTVKESGYARPSYEQTVKFQNKLEKCGINVTIRRSIGMDINGACGQLRKGYIGQ